MPVTSTGRLCEGVRERSTLRALTDTVKREAMNFLKRGFKAAKSAVGAIFGVRALPFFSNFLRETRVCNAPCSSSRVTDR
jgi:hypothetical protein